MTNFSIWIVIVSVSIVLNMTGKFMSPHAHNHPTAVPYIKNLAFCLPSGLSKCTCLLFLDWSFIDDSGKLEIFTRDES